MQIDPRELTPGNTYKLMTSLIVPRPIAFVSTIGPEGIPNVAPFSFFTGVTQHPPTLCVSVLRRDGEKKDTVKNVEWCGEFVVNVVDESLAVAMNATAGEFPREVSEFEVAGLTPIASAVLKVPRVAEALASLECRLVKIVELGITPYLASLIIGEIVCFNVRDELYVGAGKVDVAKLKPVGRLVGDLYCRTVDTFAMKRPVYRAWNE